MSACGRGRSSRNPNCCTSCNTHIEEGTLVELTMMFADLSSFTDLTNRLGADATFGVVDKYLREAGAILSSHGAYIDKYIGDAVMAYFNAPVRREDHCAAAVAAAQDLHKRLPELSKELGQDLKASVGIATGYARVGRLGSDDVKDYSAIGPVVNQAARLQAQAKSGEILVSAEVYAKISAEYPGVAPETLVLKGFKDTTVAYRLGGKSGPGPASAAPAPLEGPALSAGGLLLSIFGMGCLGKVLVGSFALSLGAGAGSALLTLALWLDSSPLRFPFLLGAAAAAV
ncbi:MAG: adenylate/guanylate cyclase domain-containing protein, partial [Elusimicrobia bacterium]|nr:adenylate/guanylate cyclase domain-containing protein [Elusimicrobiota bacterium]